MFGIGYRYRWQIFWRSVKGSPINMYCRYRAASDAFDHIKLTVVCVQGVFSELDTLATIIASAVHDIDHPGVTNQYLINTSTYSSFCLRRVKKQQKSQKGDIVHYYVAYMSITFSWFFAVFDPSPLTLWINCCFHNFIFDVFFINFIIFHSTFSGNLKG